MHFPVFNLIVALHFTHAICVAEATAPLVSITGQTMGTIRFSVKFLQLPENVSQQQVEAEINSRLERLNDQMSTYRPESEISRFNRSESTDWIEVSSELMVVVAEAINVARASRGAFDPTIGPLLKLWHFGPDANAELKLPSEDRINNAKTHVDYTTLEVRHSPPAIRKTDSKVTLELSGIAKGFAVDLLTFYLESLGIENYLVEIGGEMATRGRKPDGTAWTVGIEAPLELERRIYKAITLTNTSLATSGDYRSFYELDGRRFSHTIDPRSGRPIEFRLASVSVVAKNCMHADAMATAIMVLGPDQGYELAIARELPVMMIVREDGRFVERTTPQFDTLTQANPMQSSNWNTYIATTVIFFLAILGMAIGVIVSNRRLKGTCGGLAGMQDANGNTICDACTSPADSCRERLTQSDQSPP